MELSEEELRMLEQMERALVEEDPKFASTLRGTTIRQTARRRVIAGGAILVVGIGLLHVAEIPGIEIGEVDVPRRTPRGEVMQSPADGDRRGAGAARPDRTGEGRHAQHRKVDRALPRAGGKPVTRARPAIVDRQRHRARRELDLPLAALPGARAA